LTDATQVQRMADATQVQRVADELEIRNLVAALAHMADRAPDSELPQYAALFTEDAHWQMPGAERQGRDEILAGARERRAGGTQGPGSGTRHVVGAQRVDVDGDRARSEACFLLVADTGATPRIGVVGHYVDQLVRTPEGWRLARREITVG
jgi:uncharacterized protein (TIGR02246 family)